ncbi:MAG TPA: glycosyltransferase family 4 protein [Chitinophagaceae bacterium]
MSPPLKILSTSYSKTEGFSDPDAWLERINFYTGLLEELAKNHTVISIERIDHEGVYKRNGVEYWFIDLKKKLSRFPWRMHKRIKAARPDVMLVNGLIFPLQLIQLRYAVGKAVKIIVLHRAEKPFKGVKRHLQKLADNYVDAYLFTAAEFAKEWERNITVSNIHQVVQASSHFKAADRTIAKMITGVEGEPIFLWVGNLIERKDPLTVVKAFTEFLTHQPGARLYMIWQSGELLPAVKKMVEGVEQVRLVGKVEHNELEHWYNSADFIISGSHHEGSGIAIIEAMSCGCIPILTAIPSFKQMTAQGSCGLMYEPGNENELLRLLLKTGQMDREKERKKTLQQFAEDLSFAAIARKIETVISLTENNDKRK